jgi:hypothetical protein
VASVEGKGQREKLEAIDTLTREKAEETRLIGEKFAVEKGILVGKLGDLRQEGEDKKTQIGGLEKVIREVRTVRTINMRLHC